MEVSLDPRPLFLEERPGIEANFHAITPCEEATWKCEIAIEQTQNTSDNSSRHTDSLPDEGSRASLSLF